MKHMLVVFPDFANGGRGKPDPFVEGLIPESALYVLVSIHLEGQGGRQMFCLG